jgi:hypothetical protein
MDRDDVERAAWNVSLVLADHEIAGDRMIGCH